MLLQDKQRQHRTLHIQKDVLPFWMRYTTDCASYCAPCQPLLRVFPGWIRSPPPPAAPPVTCGVWEGAREGVPY